MRTQPVNVVLVHGGFVDGSGCSTVVEARGSHAIYVSQPAAVAAVIEQAVEGVMAATR